jgi:hypothetical protein
MRGEVSVPFGISSIPWGYISGVLLLGDRGPRGLSNLHVFDAQDKALTEKLDIL